MLVGDSLGMVLQGHDTTVPVTMDDIVYHCRAVARGLHRPFLMADLPFVSYPSRDMALANAVRLMQEGGAKMVKLESGAGQLEIVEFLARPRHRGVRAPRAEAAVGAQDRRLSRAGPRGSGGEQHARATRKALESAGADIVLLECIPSELGKSITEALHVPVIGIGAGPDTDGQILVLYDVLDITAGPQAALRRRTSWTGATATLDARQGLRAGREDDASIPRPSTASDSRCKSDADRRPTIADVRAHVARWRAAASAWRSCPPWATCTPGTSASSRRAREHGDRFVASIFVNPMQFGPNEDFAHYPRTPDEDATHAARRWLRSHVHAGSRGDLSARAASRPRACTCRMLEDILCGEFRPGHFDGRRAPSSRSCLNIVQPDVAMFGEKDFQQLPIIRRMVVDLCLPVEIVGAPTVREPDGLAMSSRNQYLSAEERAVAPTIYAELERARAAIEAGSNDFAALERTRREALRQAGFRPDYFEIRDAATLGGAERAVARARGADRRAARARAAHRQRESEEDR